MKKITKRCSIYQVNDCSAIFLPKNFTHPSLLYSFAIAIAYSETVLIKLKSHISSHFIAIRSKFNTKVHSLRKSWSKISQYCQHTVFLSTFPTSPQHNVDVNSPKVDPLHVFQHCSKGGEGESAN